MGESIKAGAIGIMKILKFRPTDLDNCILSLNSKNYDDDKKIWRDDSKWICNKIHKCLYKLQERILENDSW